MSTGEDTGRRPFADRLRALREQAGNPTIQTIAREAHCSTGAVSNALNGKVVPTDPVADGILRALGGEPDDEWRALLSASREPRPAPEPAEERSGSRRRWWWWIGGGVVVVLAAGATVLALVLPGQASGPGPWPVVVEPVGPLGLIVRSTGTPDGVQIGSTVESATLWADCVVQTGFDPRPDTGAGGRWYRIHWPRTAPGKDFLTSTPDDPAAGWVYAGFVEEPSEELPACR